MTAGAHQPVTTFDTIADLLASRSAARVFLRYRMHCAGCVIAPFETLAEACAAYGIPVERLLRDLDEAAHEEDDQ
jgi:hybrid cluster-associated redox disulfide protein